VILQIESKDKTRRRHVQQLALICHLHRFG